MKKKLIEGLDRFVHIVHAEGKQLFRSLAEGQNPDVFFVTCSDSRLIPSLVTQTEPGEMFVMRNAGHIIPPYDARPSAEAGTIEYAVSILKCPDLIVCGHSDCGALRGLFNPALVEPFPAVKSWLTLADRTRQIVTQTYAHHDDAARFEKAIETHVLLQLEALQTHPSVAAAVRAGTLALHGWVWDIGSGHARAYDSTTHEFEPLTADTVRPPAGEV